MLSPHKEQQGAGALQSDCIIHSKGIGKVLLLFPIEAKEEKQGELEYRKERGNNSHKFIHVDNHNFDLLHLHFTGKS